MSIITKLTALLTADSSQFESGMKKAGKSHAAFVNTLKTGATLAGAALATIGGAMVALGIKSAAAIEANSDLASSLGLAAKEFKAFAIVAEESGVSQEEFAAAFTKSQKAIFDAASGSKSAQENFKALGLSVSDLIKMSPKEQFIAISDALSKIQNPTERTAMAMELLGKGGRGVINMLTDLGLKVDEASEFANKFNLAVDDIDSEQVKAAGDAYGRVGMAIEGAGNTIAVTFAPLVEEASNQLIKGAASGEDFGYAIKYGMTIASMAVDVVRQAVLGFRLTFSSTIAGVLELAAKAREKLTGDGGIFRGAAEEAKQEVRGIMDEMKNFESSASKLDKIYAGARERATQNQGGGGGGLSGVADGLAQAQDKTLDLTANTKSLADMYKEFEKSSGSAIDNLITDLGRGGDAMQSFKNFAVSILQDVLKSLNGGSSIGGSLGGLIAGGLTNLLSGGSLVSQGLSSGGAGMGGLYAGLAGVTGSFATGIQNVPYDMNARLHKGEAVIPASQVDNMGSGGGGMVVNIDARGAEQGVEDKIRQVMQQVNQLRADTPKIALNVVSDQSRRNPNFVR